MMEPVDGYWMKPGTVEIAVLIFFLVLSNKKQNNKGEHILSSALSLRFTHDAIDLWGRRTSVSQIEALMWLYSVHYRLFLF